MDGRECVWKERFSWSFSSWILSCVFWTVDTCTHHLFFLFDRVSFRRKKKEDKAAKDAAKEDAKAKDEPKKKTAKEEVRTLIVDGIFRHFATYVFLYMYIFVYKICDMRFFCLAHVSHDNNAK